MSNLLLLQAPSRYTEIGNQEQTNFAVIAPAIGSPKVIEFPVAAPRCETCNAATKSCSCDLYVGSCEGCGNHVYGGDFPRVVDGVITCPTCLIEESQWKVVRTEFSQAVAA